MSRQALINAVAAAVVGLLVLGYWGYTWQQKRALDHDVAALVAEAGKLLGEALDAAPQAGQRSAGWIDEVIAARKRLDAAYFDYRSAVTSLANLLDELRPVSKALAAHAGMAALLVDEGLRARARDAARAEAERAEAEMDRIRKYPPLR